MLSDKGMFALDYEFCLYPIHDLSFVLFAVPNDQLW